jgi:hypothetical protein
MPHPDYPEHAKLANIQPKSQAIGEFLDWLEQEKNLTLCKPIPKGEEGGGQFWPTYIPVRDLLAEFFEIDQNVLEREKRAMLAYQRELNDLEDARPLEPKG